MAAAAPAAIGLGRVFLASKNDPQSLAVWLSSANLLAAWLYAALAVAIAAIAVAPVVAAIVWLFPRSSPDQLLHPLQRKPYLLKLGLIWALYGLLQVAFTGVTTIQLAVGSMVGALSALVWVIDRRRHQRRLRYGVSLVWLPVALAVAIVVLQAVITGTTGFPVERVQVQGEAEMSEGYVLSVDDVSLTLAYLDGGIRRIPTDEVGGRFVCPPPRRQQLFRSPLRSLVEASQPYISDRCGFAGVRRS